MLVLLLTQTGKVGSLSIASLDAPSSSQTPGLQASHLMTDPLVSVKTMLGPRDAPLIHALGSYLLGQISQSPVHQEHLAASGISRPLILGLSLEDVQLLGMDAMMQDDAKQIFDDLVKLARQLNVF
eukprot:jgi/Hompol1/6179/HPOL_002218-RA